MSASKEANHGGLASLKEMSQLSSVPVSTLRDWFKNKHQLFHIVLIGCVNVVKNCSKPESVTEEEYQEAKEGLPLLYKQEIFLKENIENIEAIIDEHQHVIDSYESDNNQPVTER